MGKRLKTIAYCYSHAFMMWRRRLAGIYRYAHEAGWFVMAVEASELRQFLRTADVWKVDGYIVEEGLICECSFCLDDFRGKTAVYCWNELADRMWRVVHDSEEVARCAMRELLALNLKSYGYVGYRVKTRWTDVREKVFTLETKAAGVEAAVFNPRKSGKIATIADFYGPLKDWLSNIRKPCGIFAANDEMGAHVLRAANELDIAVPDALSVIGIDNDELVCENCTPPLASVSVDFEHSGWLAAQLLAKRMRRPKGKPQFAVFGNSKVVVRPSLGRFSKRDAAVFRAIEFIRLNACGGEIRVEDVTRVMGVGRRSGEQRFKMTTGHSINEEILAVRLERAKALLADGGIPLDRIHAECGYRDGRSLRYIFARATGMSLREWRAKCKACNYPS